jgi:hypothetical protein
VGDRAGKFLKEGFMPQPVWVLSVDLQTKTATFASGMADAARTARGTFNDIKQGGDEMGRSIGGSMSEARHGVMLLGEEFGVHLPRALTSFIASIGPVGAAMEAAFPFLAIIVGATLLLEHLGKVHEAAEKLTSDQSKFATSAQNAFNALDEKIIEAGIRADELNKNHLAALHKQLQLINMQSLDQLGQEFEKLAAHAEVTFKDMQSHWYTFGIGSEGARHALTGFQEEYESLLAKGKSGEAADLLAGTLKSAERVLEMQKQYKNNQFDSTGKTNKGADYSKFEAASLELKKAGVGVTDNEVQSQQALVEALRDQVGMQTRVNDLKNAQGGNATGSANKAVNEDSYKRLKAQMDAERVVQEQEDKERDEARTRAIANLQDGERQKIEATEKGTTARLAAIDAGIKEENKYGLQETSFYRSLLMQRVEVVREMSTEEAKIKAEAGKEAAEHTQKMAEIELAATEEHSRLMLSGHRVTEQQITANELQAANRDYDIKKTALDQEIAALDKFGKEYENKRKALQDKETQLTQSHENQITQIKDKAEIERNKRILSAESQFENTWAQGLTNMLMRHQSFGAMMTSIGSQIASGMIQNALKSMMADDMTKEKDAAHAARKAFNAGMEFPFPANIVAAPAMGAAAFASVMAFNKGGLVPGVGNSDSVPAMLTPGEHVDDKELTNGLRGMVRNGGAGGHTYNVRAHFAPNISALDADGVDKVLIKHQDIFQKHFESSLRKMNK